MHWMSYLIRAIVLRKQVLLHLFYKCGSETQRVLRAYQLYSVNLVTKAKLKSVFSSFKVHISLFYQNE